MAILWQLLIIATTVLDAMRRLRAVISDCLKRTVVSVTY